MAKTDLKDRIVVYRNNGLSYNEIADKLGVTSEYARTVCSRANRASNADNRLQSDGFCKQCGRPLDMTGDHRNRLFCDDKCRSEFHNHRILHTPYICDCEFCGREFVSYGNPKKRFCSRECQTFAGRAGG